MKQLCLYHADSDGFGAAYSVWKRYGRENTDYFSTNYGEAVIDASKYNSIIMVDFSYKRDVLVEMYELLEGNLLVLDHHKSAEDDLKGLPYCVFDVRKSGASLSFAYFNNYNPHIRIPRLLEFVEDFDLWKFNYGDDTRKIACALQSYQSVQTFEMWDDWIKSWKDTQHKLITEGGAILRYQNQIIDKLKSSAHLQTWIIDGKIVEIPIVNTREVISTAGNILCQGKPFSATYYDVHGKRRWSLRSDDNGWDVSEIAKLKGGGGHLHAAGFETFDDEGPILLFGESNENKYKEILEEIISQENKNLKQQKALWGL
jgi:oligoribonuclease NrnB/cAMP/cGMP phosphodiesterase (DHH superfamily)